MPQRILRCIGGPSDGRRVAFPDDLGEMVLINPINIPDPQPGKIPNRFADTVYTARRIKTPDDGEIEFAVPAGMTMADALR